MTVRVKLCAIARNEGPYLVDWVAHHLHFGFDAVEVWVNATDDPSIELLRGVAAVRPEVSWRQVDRLRDECIAQGKVFQHRAYARLARRARDAGFSHVAFLDLDEYWTPRDFRSSIHEFLPKDPDVNVVSFQWGVGVPDPERRPFEPPLTPPVRFQLDSHVKSASRLDDSVRRYVMHTARTTSGTALLVRQPFGGGDRVPEDVLVRTWSDVPEAFVLHATNRSQVEYVASLAKGRRQAGAEADFNTDRFGFVPTEAPVLTLRPDPTALTAYDDARRDLLARIDADELIERSRSLVRRRAAEVIDRVVHDPALMASLSTALRGVDDRALDEAYPGWNDRIVWWVDAVEERDDRTVVVGWAYTAPEHHVLEFSLRDAAGREWGDLRVVATDRVEVGQERADAPVRCGFEIEVPEPLRADTGTLVLQVRVAGAPSSEARRLPHPVRG